MKAVDYYAAHALGALVAKLARPADPSMWATPNAAGIAHEACMLAIMTAKAVCANGGHDWQTKGDGTGIWGRVCERCGKVEHETERTGG